MPAIISNVSQGVSGYGNDLEIQIEHAHAGVIVQRQVTARDRLVYGAAYPRTGGRLELLDTADMVVVMVGDQNVVQLPAWMGLKPGQHGGRVARVDHRTTLVGRIL
ncbi:hypothetical protein D3C79_735800 [compost metagenome]